TLFHIGRICLTQADAQGFRHALEQLETVELEYGGGFPIYPVELRALNAFLEGDTEGWRRPFEDMLDQLGQLEEEGGTRGFELPRTRAIFSATLQVAGLEQEAKEQLRLARQHFKVSRFAGHLMELEADVPRLVQGLRQILGSA
ncbi:MAG: hypothetical protein ACE5I4_06570, partial [Thermoplasmata archaeon]